MKTKERGDWRTIENDREKYNAYLCSREWGVLKKKVHKRSGGQCERCKFYKGEAVHHLTYERKYREDLEDLQHLCSGCHAFTHGESDTDPIRDGLCDAICKWLQKYDIESLEHLYGFLIGEALTACAHGKLGSPPSDRLQMSPSFAIGFIRGTMLTSDQVINCSVDDGTAVNVNLIIDLLKEKNYWKDVVCDEA